MSLRFVRLYAHAERHARALHPRAGRRRSARRGTSLALGAAALVLLLPSCAAGQSWHAIDVARMARDSQPLAVKVRYGAGRFTLRGAESPYLYRMQLRYDDRRSKPVSRWDLASRTLTVGLEGGDMKWSSGKRNEAGDMTLALARTVPMDLSLELGATESTLDLSGIRLRTVSIKSGASATKVRFDAVTASPVERIDVDAGAAAFQAIGLANSGVARMVVNGGLGLIELDFNGVFRRDVELDLTVAVGGAEITVPTDLGVRIFGEKTFGTFDFEGLTQVGNTWETPGFADAKHKLVVRAKTAVGALKLVRR